MIKRLLSLLTVLLAFCGQGWCESVKGSDGRITYIGRVMENDGGVSFDWTGVYIKVRFQGNSLSLNVSDSHKNYFNVWLDKDMSELPDKVISTFGNDSTIVLFSLEEMKSLLGKDKKALKAPHQVILQKRTEGSQGKTTFKGFATDGLFLQADQPSERVMEFIGDSYTCGYGTEASNTERFSPETENQNLTYACMTARYFGAEQIVLAHSGMGISRNYNGKYTDDNMVSRYLRFFDSDAEPAWDAGKASLKPDITVIYLGTNDFSTGLQPAQRVFVKNYIKLLSEIKDNYGKDHPILCVAPKHDPLQETYIRSAIESSGLSGIHFLPLSHSVHNSVGDMGADGHPNGSGHRKIAFSVIPVVSTIMGWEMTNDKIL